MSNISQIGTLNIASLTNDDVYVVIVPPGPLLIRGVPTDVIGVVGTGGWGPINQVISIGSLEEAPSKIGFTNSLSKHDLATAVTAASTAGGNRFRCIRVAKGDVAATVNIMDVAGSPDILNTLTAKWTGSMGDNIIVRISRGSKSVPNSTLKVQIILNGTTQPRETYDNLPADNTFKDALVLAITNGQGPLRPPSQIVTAVVNAANTTGLPPTAAVVSLNMSGGDDGSGTGGAGQWADDSEAQLDMVGSVTGAVTGGPSGMYALENSGSFQFALVGLDDTTRWSDVVAFALVDGQLAVLGFLSGRETDDCIDDKQSAGIDSFAAMCIKDYVLWDDVRGKIRVGVPPEAVALGKIAALSPEQGVGNKAIFGFVGTTRTDEGRPYTGDETSKLIQAGINFITNPIPAGNLFGMRHNQNASSDGTVNGVNYTRMTNFLAKSFANSLGAYVGRVQSTQLNDQLRHDARATLEAFLQKLKQLPARGGTGMIDDYSLVLDETNNTPQSIGEGFLRANIAVRYLAVVRFFLVYLQAGQTVVVVTEGQDQATQAV